MWWFGLAANVWLILAGIVMVSYRKPIADPAQWTDPRRERELAHQATLRRGLGWCCLLMGGPALIGQLWTFWIRQR